MTAVKSWNRELAKLSTIFFFVYFVQGMSSLPGLPVNYLIKNVLKLSPADAQFFGAATMLAWLVKPVWGYLSDTFPIMGYRRKSYLIGMSLIAAGSWFLLAWFAAHNDYRYWTLLILFNFSAMAYAFVDVVCDGLMVENGKRSGLLDQFVNLQWIGAGVSGIVVGLLSGYLAKIANTQPGFYAVIFSAAGVVPLITALLVFSLLQEDPIKITFPWRKLGLVLAATAAVVAIVLKMMPWFLKLTVGARILILCGGFTLISVLIWFWAERPRFFWAINLFIFFWGFSPSIGMARFYYLSDVLKFSEGFFGLLTSLDSIFGVTGYILYSLILAKYPAITRKQYLYFSIALGACGLGIQYLYYLDPAWGLNYYAIAVTSSVFFAVLGAPGWLIPLAIAGDASKNGKEAVTYAWFMSASNFARLTLSDLTGGWLYQQLEKANLSLLAPLIGTGDFLGTDANKVLILRLFVWISALFTLATVPIVYAVRFPERNESTEGGSS